MSSVDDKVVVLVLVVGGALMGLALAAVAHLGVLWQLRRRADVPPSRSRGHD
jgi:hypothetical protein